MANNTKSFTVLTEKPNKSDKYIYLYNNSSNGGKSRCINGKPKDSTCNVLCNCVGWACGRFNHIYNLLTGYDGIKYDNFCCHAEKFIKVAKDYGLTIGTEPKAGSIMVWLKGATLESSDGSGHVAIVEKVISSTQVYTSESGYNSFDFANKTRNKGDGNWGASSTYTFRGFIYNPAVDNKTLTIEKSTVKISQVKLVEPTKRDTNYNLIQVLSSSLRIRKTPSLNGNILGLAEQGYYNYTNKKSADKYTWYLIGNNQWIAYNSNWAKLYEAQNFKIGDKCKLKEDAVKYNTTLKFYLIMYKILIHIKSINDNKVGFSIIKNGPIIGYVDKKYLEKS